MQKCWAGREKQIEKLTLSTAGLYGDVQGIVGRSLPQIALLEIEGQAPGESDDPEG
jgi:hypothetical protein